MKGINIEEKDAVVFAGQNVSDDYLIVTNNGFAKRLSSMQIPICARYRKGVKYINFENSGKFVSYAGTGEKVVVDHGLKFAILEKKKLKVSSDRLSVGEEIVKKKFLGIYAFED